MNMFWRSTRVLIAVTALTVLATPVIAGPVDVTFLPPHLPAQKVCQAKATDQQVIAFWTGWTGAGDTGLTSDDILGDARRLRDIDANRYFDLVGKMLDLAQSRTAKKTAASDIDIDRINLFLKAGRVQELARSRLVSKTEARGPALTSKGVMLLSGLYNDGVVVKRDPAKAQQLLVRAALGGEADALLALAKLNVGGAVIPGWTMPPKIAVTLAFGSLVGKLDPDICARLNRIAREYGRGDTVQQDYGIAEKWYRLAADLGDPDSAWKVAGMHLDSELLVKDNDTLLQYLIEASDEGVAAAQVELGKIYESGALVPADAAKARHYFESAAAQDNRNGIIQLISYLEGKSETDDDRAKVKSLVAQLTALPDPPGWAFTKRAKQVLLDQGLWAGEQAALPLLQKGADLGDPDAAQLLADLLLRHPDTPGNFERAIGLIQFAVDNGSKSDSMPRMRDVYLCRAPAKADFALSDYWQADVDAASNATETLTDGDIATLVAGENADMLATLQTHALYGRPTAVASYVTYLKQVGADQPIIDFWNKRVQADPSAVATVARRELKGNQDPGIVDDALARLRSADENGLASARLDLAAVLIDRFPGDAKKTAEGMKLLDEAAQSGSGEAIFRLLSLDATTDVTRAKLYEQYSTAIDTRGDADALFFAASTSDDPAKRSDYLGRAISIAECNFDNAYHFAQIYTAWGNIPAASHWAAVAEHLVSSNAHQYSLLADLDVGLPDPDLKAKAIDLYRKALGLGDGTSFDRLFKMYTDSTVPTYSPRRAIDLVHSTLGAAPVPMIQFVLQKIDDTPSAMRQLLLKDVDIAALYRKPAEGGNVDAILALAKYLQEAGGPVEGAEAAQWLQKAADSGDPRAQVALAKAYAFGTGVELSISHARELLRLAAASGSNEAQKLLANMLS